jgi:hypothetical protein
MVLLSSAPWSLATWHRSRCKSRSSTHAARARRHLSGCVPARVPWRRRNGGTRHRAGRRCNRCRRRGSRGRAGTADKGKSARSRKSRNRPARPAPGRRSSDRDIFAIWDRARCVFARRIPFSLSAPAPAGEGDHPAQQGGGRGAGGNETLTTTGKRRCEIHSNLFYEQTKNLPAVILLQRRRSGTASAPSTTVRSLRELQWSPSPAGAGADGASDSVLATHPRPSLQQERKPLLFRLQIK